MINPVQFTEYAVAPALKSIQLWDKSMEVLVVGTALQSTELRYLAETASGSTYGVFAMTEDMYKETWDWMLSEDKNLALMVAALSVTASYAKHNGVLKIIPPGVEELTWNLRLAAAVTACHYTKVCRDNSIAELPSADDIPEMAVFWKEYYDTYLGDGTEEEFEEVWMVNMPTNLEPLNNSVSRIGSG